MRLVRCLSLLLALVVPALTGGQSVLAQDASQTALSHSRVEQTQPLLFGASEVFSPDNSAFGKWNDMLARFQAAERQSRTSCAVSPAACEPAVWRNLLGEISGLDLRAKLDRVNAAVNRQPYVPSFRNWGESNHWETPFEFFAKGGQCQDYAIAKYLLLRAAGIPAARLRIVVLRDTELGLDHAVTVVYVDGDALVLDNQRRNIVAAREVRHYQPYYSINEQGWWLHRGAAARYAAAG